MSEFDNLKHLLIPPLFTLTLKAYIYRTGTCLITFPNTSKFLHHCLLYTKSSS